MRVEVWSDVVCPWCFLGKHRLEQALAELPFGDEVEVVWRSFELDPAAPPQREGTASEHLMRKYGMSPEQVEASWARLTALGDEVGIDYRLPDTKGGNSFDAHRLLQFAGPRELQGEMKERLLKAYFTEGRALDDHGTLADIAAEAGLDRGEAADVLATGAFADEVRADETQAREFGISAVPFFVIDNRYAIAGAQPTELLREALEAAWSERAAA